MATAQTHPGHWQRMLQLLDKPDKTDFEAKELSELQALFRGGKEPVEKKKAFKVKVTLISPEGEVIFTSKTRSEFKAVTGLTDHFIEKALENFGNITLQRLAGYKLEEEEV